MNWNVQKEVSKEVKAMEVRLFQQFSSLREEWYLVQALTKSSKG